MRTGSSRSSRNENSYLNFRPWLGYYASDDVLICPWTMRFRKVWCGHIQLVTDKEAMPAFVPTGKTVPAFERKLGY